MDGDVRPGLFIRLRNKVGVYGGLAGTETALQQRDPETNQTILSGDRGAVEVIGGLSHNLGVQPLVVESHRWHMAQAAIMVYNDGVRLFVFDPPPDGG